MRATGESGRVLGPVGLSRSLLPVGEFGRWAATIEIQVHPVRKLGGSGLTAEPATIAGSATGWEPDPFYWPALAEPSFEVELDEWGTMWRFPARVTFTDGQIAFKAIGQAVCLPGRER